MKYFKKFETHDPDYLNYINSEDCILPNLSYCEDVGDVHLNKIDTRLICKYNVTNTTEAIELAYSPYYHDYASENFSEMEIDGVVQSSIISSYTFDTTGEHIVKYTLINPTIIGESAFYNCTNLTSITIPNSVTSIGGSSAFQNCSGLTTVKLGKHVTTIGQYAFKNCGITNLIIPDSVTTISQSVFEGCSGLTSVTIPDSVTSIGQSAFYGCSGLTSITIPDSVTSIGDHAFADCYSLTNAIINNGFTVDYQFQNCINLTNVILGNNCTTIGYESFYGCTKLTSIGPIGSGSSLEMSDSVTTIGNYAFHECTGLTNVIIGNGVTSIGNSVFNSCDGLTSVTISSSVTSIGNGVFSYCDDNLTDIISLATTAPTIQNNTFGDIKTYGTLTVPIGSTGYDTWMNQLQNLYWTKVEQ